MSEKLWHLKTCDLFSRLSPDQIDRIETRSRSRTIPAGTPIYLPSEKADSVFLLVKGLVKVCHLTMDGKESILAFVEPGELFGELAIFGDEDRDEYVETIETSTVMMIPAAEITQLMAVHSDVAFGITKLINLRRHRIERRLKNLLFLSNRERLVQLLLDLAEQFGSQADDGIRLHIKLSHQDLGNLIGSTRETVTVILGQLRAEGSIDGGRRRIVLTDPQRLARSVNRQVPRELRPKTRLLPAIMVS